MKKPLRNPALALAVMLILSAVLPADVITPMKGAPFRGRVMSIDDKSVTVKTDSETRVMDRSAIRKIEFGDVLITGLQGREYVNAEYRVKATIPAGWTAGVEPGADLVGRKGACIFLLKGIPIGSATSDGSDEIKGALGGMKATVPDAVFGETEVTTWAGVPVKKVSVTASGTGGLAIFPRRSEHLLLIMFLAEPGKPKAAASCAAEWEKQFRFLEE